MSQKRDIFEGTAKFYARFRPGYPDQFFNYLVRRFKLNGQGRLLDLGCGTGQLTLPLAKYFEEAIGLDPELEMLAEARKAAKRAHVKNAKWVERKAEDISPDFGSFRLAIMGRSFHWMDRDLVLKKLYKIIADNGGIVVVSDFGTKGSTTNEWQNVVQDVIKRWLGEKRRAGSSFYVKPKELHEAIIQHSSFKNMETYTLNFQRHQTIKDIIGYIYSTSYCSPKILGKKRLPFEKDL